MFGADDCIVLSRHIAQVQVSKHFLHTANTKLQLHLGDRDAIFLDHEDQWFVRGRGGKKEEAKRGQGGKKGSCFTLNLF
jgi:hypothetical protein